MYRFNGFTFDPETGRLDHRGRPTETLRPKSARALAFLLEHAGEVVTRKQLVEAIWPEEHVVNFEAGLSAILGDIRRALDDSASEPCYLETIPRRGYRFLREVRLSSVDRRTERRAATWTTAALAAIGVLALAAFLLFRQFIPDNDKFEGQLAVTPITVYPKAGEAPRTSWLLTDTLIAELWQQRPAGVEIVGRSALERRDSDRETAKAFGRRLGVDWVLHGFLRKREENWVLTLSLYRLPEAQLEWTVELDAGKTPGDDADKVARKAAGALAEWARKRD